MASLSFLSLITCLISLFPASHAFNITKMLDQEGGFGTFNSLLSQTQLATAINNRRTITLLVVSNDNLSQLSSQPTSVIRKILSLHVILDYYDTQKLKNLQKKSAILTTLFQTSGQARGQQGFLNVTVMKNGDVAFGSAVPGSKLGANLGKSVASQPYNISILEISSVIMIDVKTDAPTTSPPAPPTGSPKKAPPTGSPKKAPSPKKSPTESPSADSPDDASSPTADGPAREAGSTADAPPDHASTANKVSDIISQLATIFLLMMSYFWW